MILQNGNLLDDGKQYRHRYILNIPTFQYHVHFMLAYVQATSAVGSSAVLYLPTPHPPPPSTSFLCWFRLLYIILPDSLIFKFSFVPYSCVFVLESYLSCWSMCFNNNRDYESWRHSLYMSGTNNVFSKKSNSMMLTKKTRNFLCKMNQGIKMNNWV